MQINLDCPETKFKRKKSETKYPKNLPTFIVAFALNENNKKSSVQDLTDRSQERIIPTTSTQVLTTNKSKQNIVTVDAEASNEIKNECGDAENIFLRPTSNTRSHLNLNEATSQPRILFNAQRHAKRPKFNAERNMKRSKIRKRVVKVKNVYFKNKRAGCYMTRNLKKYYKKARGNSESPRQIQKGLYHDTISKRVSRKPMLRKVLAKENLLEEIEKPSFFEMNVPENKDGFFICSPLEGNSSFVSDSSQGTLTRQDSLSSRNEVVTTTNSVIRVNDLKTSPFKADIINVAVAQITNAPNLNRNSYSLIVLHKDASEYQGNPTSAEPTLSQTLTVTSSISTEGATRENISDPSSIDYSVSDKTLIAPNKETAASCDTFDFHNPMSSCNRNCNCDRILNDINCGTNDLRSYDKKDNLHRTQQLYNDIINMSLYPKAAPCSSSVPDFPNNDNVIIADDILKTQLQIKEMKNRGDEKYASVQNNFHTNIFQKPFHIENAVDHQKNPNLPNAAHLRTNMIDPSVTHRKCSEEARDNYPTSFPELFDKLTIVLEIAVKNLENSLSAKIENEIRKSFHEFEKRTHPIPKFNTDISELLPKDLHLEDLKRSSLMVESKPMIDMSLQCNIIKNEVLDEIMIGFSKGQKSGVQSSSSNITQKIKEPKLLKDYIEVLKAPFSSHYKEQEVGKGDSVKISVEDATDQQIPQFECTKSFFWAPITFVRENMVVITSVPAFLFVIFVIYSYVLLIMRMSLW